MYQVFIRSLLACTTLIALAPHIAKASESKPDFATTTLTGNWGGLRDTLYAKGYNFEFVYTPTAWRNLKGGVKKGNRVLDNLDLQLGIDGEKAFGSKGTSFNIYLLNNNGGRINELVGSNSGIDNMETSTPAFKLFEAWAQQNFADDRVSILAGLRDLNAEFYVTDSSALFLNPTFGIGTEAAATGDNSMSLFPTSGLTLRATVKPSDITYISTAISEGVPGDPNNAKGTHVQFDDKEGALLLAEGGVWADDIGHFGCRWL